MQKFYLFIFSLITLLCGFLGCSKKNTFNLEAKELTLVTSGDYPPFEFVKSGAIVGLDIDIAKSIAQYLGVTLKIEDIGFSNIIPALNAGRADFAMAGLSVTPERQENVDFSIVYYQPSLAILTHQDKTIPTIANLTGKTLGAQMGSIMEQFVKEKSTQMPGITLISLAKNPDLVQELKVGRVDGVVLEAAQAAAFAENHADLAFSVLPNAVPGYAIAFPKQSPWVEKFNQAIAILNANGQIQAIENEWLNLKTDI